MRSDRRARVRGPSGVTVWSVGPRFRVSGMDIVVLGPTRGTEIRPGTPESVLPIGTCSSQGCQGLRYRHSRSG